MAKKKADEASAPRASAGGKRARTRRRTLKSIVAGGAATTVWTLPEKWMRPVTESVMLPVHAQVSEISLACRVDNITADPSAPTGFDPDGPPFTGGDNTTVDEFGGASNQSSLPITLTGVSATVNPASAGDVTLSLATDPNFTLNAVGPFDVTPNGIGVATFANITGDLDAGPDPGEYTGNLELTFSVAGSQSCVINFTFAEFLEGTDV